MMYPINLSPIMKKNSLLEICIKELPPQAADSSLTQISRRLKGQHDP